MADDGPLDDVEAGGSVMFRVGSTISIRRRT
jgi:hypothetical protein